MKLLEFYFYIMFGLLFCRVGFPLMLITTVIAMFYLLICHVAFQWHPTWTCLFVLYTVYNRKGCKFQTVIVFSPKKTPKKTQLTTVKFNWFYVQWIFVASLHFFMISFFVIPQYSKCNAYYFMYYVIFMLWIQKWIIVISSFDIFLFNNRYITIKVTCIKDCDIILYIIVCISIYFRIFTATCTCISFVLSLTLLSKLLSAISSMLFSVYVTFKFNKVKLHDCFLQS